VIFENVQVGVF